MINAFLPYVIEAVYAVAHAIHNIYFCTEPHGLLPGGKCPYTYPSVQPLDVDLYLRNVSFQGSLGKVEFHESGNPLISSYDVINFQQRFERSVAQRSKRTVGTWSKISMKNYTLIPIRLNGVTGLQTAVVHRRRPVP